MPVDPSLPLKLLILGSGSSAAVPDISCLTDSKLGCACCRASITHEGAQNRRGNTGAVIRVPQVGGGEKIILIDCGKTFREQAIKFFPEKKLRRIDAVILTHHHADAIDGLDDLRAWTYGDRAIEDHIPIFCTRETYKNIAEGFPYMMNKKASSGSGAVPRFNWQIFDETDSLLLCGIRLTPLPMHHGKYFSTTTSTPLIALGFLINSTLLYVSDVSYIPESTWSRLAAELALPNPDGTFPPPSYPPLPHLAALVVDCTGLRLGRSHFGLPQAVGTARRLGVKRVYLTDLPHMISTECWRYFGERFGKGWQVQEGRGEVPWSTSTPSSAKGEMAHWRKWAEGEQQASHAEVYRGFDPVEEGYELFTQRALQAIEAWDGGRVAGERPWVRPAVDGMTICWSEGERLECDEERVWDDVYH